MDKMEVGKKYQFKDKPSNDHSVYKCLGVFQDKYCWMIREGSKSSPYTYLISLFKPYKESIHFGHWYEYKECENDKLIPLMVSDDVLFYKYMAVGKWSHATMNVNRFLDTFKHIGSIG